MKQILFSRQFPATHPKKGESTFFVEKLWKSLTTTMGYSEPEYFQSELPELQSVLNNEVYADVLPKHHTIRAGKRWKEGEYFAPKIWSGKPYRSKCIQFAPAIQVKKVYDFSIGRYSTIHLGSMVFDSGFNPQLIDVLSRNDGLSYDDFKAWFGMGTDNCVFEGQIIVWSNAINYCK